MDYDPDAIVIVCVACANELTPPMVYFLCQHCGTHFCHYCVEDHGPVCQFCEHEARLALTETSSSTDADN